MRGLKEVYKDYFKIGAAINSITIQNETDIIKKHFNSITFENQMKYGVLFNDNFEYNFSGADELYNFAKANNLDIRGHNFVWHNQTPYHIFNKSKEEVWQLLTDHIKIMNERYGDKTQCWDVINEAVEDKSSAYLRKSPWLDMFGSDYCRKVFALARSILPDDVQLFYNDYNEYIPEKRDKIIKLIKNINKDEKLVDGVGMQCHVNLYYPTIDLVKEAIEMYASLGLRIHITEMDISHFRFDDTQVLESPDPHLEKLHAKAYGDYFKVFREYSDYIDNVTLWGVSDRYTWLDDFPVKNRKNWPLLFDENGDAKPALYSIMDI